MDLTPTAGVIPVGFGIPFSLDTIDPAKSYVVTGEIVDGTTTWANTTGVPVITNGNAISDVQVVVTPVVAAPSPSPSPIAAPESGVGDATPALLLVILALILGAIGFFLWSRSRNEPPSETDPPTPADDVADPGLEVPGTTDAPSAHATRLRLSRRARCRPVNRRIRKAPRRRGLTASDATARASHRRELEPADHIGRKERRHEQAAGEGVAVLVVLDRDDRLAGE
jgi:hypothetical protein